MQLREELQKPQNRDIHDAAILGRDFEECLGIIAKELSIVLDGDYDVDKLCTLLVTQLRARHYLPLATRLKQVN